MHLTRKLRWLRVVLGSVLALHLGFAQAGMVHISTNARSGGAQAIAPCHAASHAASMAGMPGMSPDTAATLVGDATAVDTTAAHTTAADTTAHGTQHSPCCGEGLCHCAAASGFSATPASSLSGIAPRTLAPRFATHATSQAQPARELRPPISR